MPSVPHYFPNELKLMIASYSNPSTLSNLRLTSRDWCKCATPFLFQALVLDFSRHAGNPNPIYRPVDDNGNPISWQNAFQRINAVTYPVNRNWGMQDYQRFYARMIAPHQRCARSPRQRIEELLANPVAYNHLLHWTTRFVIKIDNLNHIGFNEFVTRTWFDQLVEKIPNLEEIEMHMNVVVAQNHALRQFVIRVCAHAGFYRVKAHFYGNEHFFTITNGGVMVNPPTGALLSCHSLHTLESHDFICPGWAETMATATERSQHMLKRLAVGSGPVHPGAIDDILVILANKYPPNIGWRLLELEEIEVYDTIMRMLPADQNLAWYLGDKVETVKMGNHTYRIPGK